MNAAEKSQRLPAIQKHVAARRPARQMFGRQALFQGLAGILAENGEKASAHDPPAIARRVLRDPLEQQDVAQNVLQIARGYIGTCWHFAISGLGAPQREKMFVGGVDECQCGIAEVMPVLSNRLLIESPGCCEDIHAPIFDWKLKLPVNQAVIL